MCNIVVWATPLNPNGKITEFEAEFFIPDANITIVRSIPKDRTFYIVEEEDKLGDLSNILVRVIITVLTESCRNYLFFSIQVRASTSRGPGEWSTGKSLGR